MNRNSFIAQTAMNYCMSYADVEYLYKVWSSDGLFYEKLEEFILERQQ